MASFQTQANALFRKDSTLQKRNLKANIQLILPPMLLFALLLAFQYTVNNAKKASAGGRLCHDEICYDPPPDSTPQLNIPANEFRAVRTDAIPFTDLPDASCRRIGSCPVTMLFTGDNKTLGQILSKNMYSSPSSNQLVQGFSEYMKGTIYDIEPRCLTNGKSSWGSPCVEGLYLWRNSSSDINKELYMGYRKGNKEGKINEIVAGYDFLDSGGDKLNVRIWYNSTRRASDLGNNLIGFPWIPRSVNLASNAFLKYLMGPDTKILFEFLHEMPNPLLHSALLSLNTPRINALFFTWVVLQLFLVVLTQLVYEKEQRLRIMMKMHGLGDGPYWFIKYVYFFCMSSIYMLCLVSVGLIVGLEIFKLNNYIIQAVFYFIYINLQIAMAILLSEYISNVKTVRVLGSICVFGTGLLGSSLFVPAVENIEFPRVWVILMELYPGFSLYRGLYEFGQYPNGMCWGDLNDSENGMKEILIIMSIEWFFLNLLSPGKSPLFLFKKIQKNSSTAWRMHGSKVSISMEKPDVHQEREKVEQLLRFSIICDDIKMIYPGRKGIPDKIAVRGLSLALSRGECFGMLGPSGAGKTSFMNMMMGLTRPTAGTAYVEGLDIQTEMDSVHTVMGVCPQDDLLWETLTGREHLLFYGRLKNLKGSELTQAVEESLKRLKFYDGVADKQAGGYSSGMKRRLSVAISLIGNPKVVYLDEPSSGLDPASRDVLWNVLKHARRSCTIFLTTHSMKEAEASCDRLGILVDGHLQCIGNPKELKARYGGSYVFTMTTPSNHKEQVESLVRCLSPGVKRVYHISGTQKFELPKNEVRIADVLEVVEKAKSKFRVYAWGLTDTTLEDVFIKVVRGAQAINTLS